MEVEVEAWRCGKYVEVEVWKQWIAMRVRRSDLEPNVPPSPLISTKVCGGMEV
jgi:hypothetical protein